MLVTYVRVYMVYEHLIKNARKGLIEKNNVNATILLNFN